MCISGSRIAMYPKQYGESDKPVRRFSRGLHKRTTTIKGHPRFREMLTYSVIRFRTFPSTVVACYKPVSVVHHGGLSQPGRLSRNVIIIVFFHCKFWIFFFVYFFFSGIGMEATDILPVLQERVATVPGGRDLNGRPLVVVVVQPWINGHLETALRYYSSLFRYTHTSHTGADWDEK